MEKSLTEMIEDVYNSDQNYCVKDIDLDNKKCLILFSSNGLYFPNTEASFQEKIVENDRYDFKNVTNCRKVERQFGKIIYVRDLWRAWYVRGINETQDTIDKLVMKLAELTEGYRIVTAGSSSGGYMAVIAGIRLQAELVFSFSGQFCLNQIESKRIVRDYVDDEERSRYFDITKLIEGTNVPIVYCYPRQSNGDAKQAELVKNYDNMAVFSFAYAEHAKTVSPYNFKYLFGMPAERCRKLSRRFSERQFRAMEFLIVTGGIGGGVDCIRMMFRSVRGRMMRMLH